jgi:hypothetical protein
MEIVGDIAYSIGVALGVLAGLSVFALIIAIPGVLIAFGWRIWHRRHESPS